MAPGTWSETSKEKDKEFSMTRHDEEEPAQALIVDDNFVNLVTIQ